MEPPTTIKLLLIEDSEDDAFFFCHALKKTGLPAELEHAKDGREALEYLNKTLLESASHPDLIFLDLKLPVRSGFEILEWIAQQDFHPPLKVCILSGSDQQTDIARALELGAGDYVVKPLSREDLKKRLLALQAEKTLDAAELASKCAS